MQKTTNISTSDYFYTNGNSTPITITHNRQFQSDACEVSDTGWKVTYDIFQMCINTKRRKPRESEIKRQK
jgi:hypothetical protein